LDLAIFQAIENRFSDLGDLDFNYEINYCGSHRTWSEAQAVYDQRFKGNKTQCSIFHATVDPDIDYLGAMEAYKKNTTETKFSFDLHWKCQEEINEMNKSYLTTDIDLQLSDSDLDLFSEFTHLNKNCKESRKKLK
jgi:hypothetical protein